MAGSREGSEGEGWDVTEAVREILVELYDGNQSRFARALDFSQPVVSGWLSGAQPGLAACIRISEKTGYSLNWIARGIKPKRLDAKQSRGIRNDVFAQLAEHAPEVVPEHERERFGVLMQNLKHDVRDVGGGQADALALICAPLATLRRLRGEKREPDVLLLQELAKRNRTAHRDYLALMLMALPKIVHPGRVIPDKRAKTTPKRRK